MLVLVDNKDRVCVDENKSVQLITIEVSKEIEVIASPEEGLATLFYNEIDMEFLFNSKTAIIVNKMIGARFIEQLWYMQQLELYRVGE